MVDGFSAGVLAGVVGTIALSSGHSIPQAMAQFQAPPRIPAPEEPLCDGAAP
jgi:hypothetical protein